MPDVGTPVGGVSDGGLFSRRYREVTIASIVFGVVVGAVMNAAITYAGLKIGFTIVGSAIAAVLGFGVLRGLLRRGSILETNIGQTIASAVNTPCSGVIFTVPVLLLLGFRLTPDVADFWLITLACVAGAVLGCAFIVPLRKQMLDIERLRFPSAVAVGQILRSPGAGPKKALLLVLGVVVSALIAAPAQLPQITSPASLDRLDELLDRERITRADALLTREIARWIEAGSAPAAVVAHGEAALALVEGKAEASPSDLRAMDAEARRSARARLAELESSLASAEEAGFSAVSGLASEHGSDRSRVLSYPQELAKRAALAARGESAWSSLRSTASGWAASRPFGYLDIGWRLSGESEPGSAAVDYPHDGLGDVDDAVLTVESDRDRDGRPDLVMTDKFVDAGRALGFPDEMQLVFAIAPFAIGAGFLTGRAGLLVLAGGVLAYLVINPVLYGLELMPASIASHEAPSFGHDFINRPLGIGLLLGGAMMGVLVSLPAIREAFKSIAAAGRSRPGGRDELGLRVLLVAVLAALLLLFVAADFTGSEPINTVDPVSGDRIEFVQADLTAEHRGYVLAFADEASLSAWSSADESQREAWAEPLNANVRGVLSGLNEHVRALIIAVVGALWIWFAGIIIAQCTGMTDWSPISGMALLTVVLVMLLGGPGATVGAVLIGAALCVAITCAADMMADLKTGYIVGAMPKRQQTVELIATGIGPLITMGVLLVIVAANERSFGVPIGPGTDTTAPQAQALQAVITGVQGGDMPYALYGAGAVLGALLGLGSFSGLGVLVGLSMYLPMAYIATYGIGCLINIGLGAVRGRRWTEEWGVPLAAGLIVGDAVLSLGASGAVLLLG